MQRTDKGFDHLLTLCLELVARNLVLSPTRREPTLNPPCERTPVLLAMAADDAHGVGLDVRLDAPKLVGKFRVPSVASLCGTHPHPERARRESARIARGLTTSATFDQLEEPLAPLGRQLAVVVCHGHPNN